ncbi:hypothetical protein PLICRDRAFT_169031 [Plicaturopsis crispa FD-325 SS-3]|uniref:Enoyl reductase (ER) domain-containing protein n=1 Tax=Plicaturopsis crispa FD-325 SS-3 TaxID=944288 RepID=A0A0C9SQ32_PLICR|nr:hypothetical protein PLICRDRAFT_169031 [Plicaturopsis crispa FD-325 SS-3]
MANLPTHRRKWLVTKRGTPAEALQLVENDPIPSLEKGEILVKVHFSALTPSLGRLMGIVHWPLRSGPAITELEFGGWVANTNGNPRFNENDEVIGMVQVPPHLKRGRGTMAEYIAIDAEEVVKKPAGVSLRDASGLPGAGLTAWQSLITVGKLTRGQRVFVNGGSSPTGSCAIQIAKAMGATEVVTSCSAGNFDLVKSLGADIALDYTKSPLVDQLRDLKASFDIIFDAIGIQDLYASSADYLVPSGKYLSIAFEPMHKDGFKRFTKELFRFLGNFIWPAWAGGIPRKFYFVNGRMSKEDLEMVADLAQQGKLRVPVDSVHKSNREGVLAAYDRILSSRAKGKVLVNMLEY